MHQFQTKISDALRDHFFRLVMMLCGGMLLLGIDTPMEESWVTKRPRKEHGIP